MNLSIELICILLLGLINVVFFLLLWAKKSQNPINDFRQILEQNQQSKDEILRNEFQNNRMELNASINDQKLLLTDQMKLFGNHQNQWFQSFQKQLQYQASNQTETLENLQSKVSKRIKDLQQDNKKQLDKMRETVDEKLHKTLEDRLGKSFERVSKHLEAVQKGLGEMQVLASGVGDLKKVLSNVKTRGVMGEMLLGNILEQILTPDQYSLNVKTIPHSSAHVEFAIKFPGNEGHEVWLPIDSKFPMDKYEYLQDAYDHGSNEEIDKAQNELKKTVYIMAKDIHEKYISPPYTTDFGVLFLPVEGLYAELVRHPGIMMDLQTKYKIMLAGPTNLSAFLNSLQLGFRTLAIEKRSSEVWSVLSKVKTEFSRFGEALDKVQTKLQQASKTIDTVGVRSRAIERNLREVGELPVGESQDLLDDLID